MKKILSVLVLLCSTSCVSDANFKAYVIADRSATTITHTHYRQMISASTLSPEDKATHEGRLQAKENMLLDAEKLLGAK